MQWCIFLMQDAAKGPQDSIWLYCFDALTLGVKHLNNKPMFQSDRSYPHNDIVNQ